MVILSACCGVIGVAPVCVAPFLDRMASAWSGSGIGGLGVAASAPLLEISVAASVLGVLLLAGIGFLLMKGVSRAPTSPTWDCGYAAPSARMQYTSSSFAEMLVSMFAWALQPKVHRPRITELFPEDADFESHIEDTVLQTAVLPTVRAVTWVFSWGRYLQSGSLQAYLMYILVVVVFLLLWN